MDMVSVPVVKPGDFLNLKQQAKVGLSQDMNLDKAAELTAQRNVLLMDKDIPPAIKRAQLKVLNRKVAHWTKKVRQPFGDTGGSGGEVGPVETDVSPTQNMIKALINTIKTPAEEVTVKPKKRRPVDDLTPVATPPTRPAKKKAKKALGVSTPLSAPFPEVDEGVEEEEAAASSSLTKGKQYLKKKGKEFAKKKATDVAKKWLDF